MDKVKQFLSGNKTYIIFAITFILGGLKASGIEIPTWVMEMLIASGLVTLRAGVKKAEAAAHGQDPK